MSKQNDNTAPKHGENPENEWSKSSTFPSAPPFDVEVGDEAKPYSSDFFGYKSEAKKSQDNDEDSWDSTMAEEQSAIDKINALITEALGAAVEKKSFKYFPEEFDEGQHMASFSLNGSPLSISHFSTEKFAKVNAGEDGHLSLAMVDAAQENLKITMAELQLGKVHGDISIRHLSEELMNKNTDNCIAESNLDSGESLQLHYDIKNKMLICDATGKGPRCFQVTGRGVYDLTKVKDHSDLKSGDMIIILSGGLISNLTRAALNNLTRGAYMGPVLYKKEKAGYNPRTEEQATDVPTELLESEVANQLQELIKSSFAGPNLQKDEVSLSYEDTPYKRIFQQLSKLASPADDEKWGTINTDAFVIYQIP